MRSNGAIAGGGASAGHPCHETEATGSPDEALVLLSPDFEASPAVELAAESSVEFPCFNAIQITGIAAINNSNPATCLTENCLPADFLTCCESRGDEVPLPSSERLPFLESLPERQTAAGNLPAHGSVALWLANRICSQAALPAESCHQFRAF